MALDRLSAEDAEILRLENSTTCGHTCKVLLLEPSDDRPLPTLQALREHIGARLDAVPRLRRRLADTPLGLANPVWVDDPHFDVARHVTEIAPGPHLDRSALSRLVAELMAQHLDREHPLWHLGVVGLVENSLALIWRVHHCLADGATFVRLGSTVLWSEARDADTAKPSPWSPEPAPSGLRLMVSGLADRYHAETGNLYTSPRRLRSVRGFRQLFRRELSPRASLTPLAHRIGTRRRVAFARASLSECRRAGKAIGESVTLNDVALALVAGGVRAWLKHNGNPTAGIRVKVPVSMHHAGDSAAAANRLSYFVVDLPVEEVDPAQRVLKINRETSERKHDRDAEALAELGHRHLVAQLAESPRVFTFSVSNVRGPANDIYVLGARVRELYSLAEISSQHALRVAVISAGDSLAFGLLCDGDGVKDLDIVAEGIDQAAAELRNLAR